MLQFIIFILLQFVCHPFLLASFIINRYMHRCKRKPLLQKERTGNGGKVTFYGNEKDFISFIQISRMMHETIASEIDVKMLPKMKSTAVLLSNMSKHVQHSLTFFPFQRLSTFHVLFYKIPICKFGCLDKTLA